jgi:hypothetical protein
MVIKLTPHLPLELSSEMAAVEHPSSEQAKKAQLFPRRPAPSNAVNDYPMPNRHDANQ